MPQRFLRPGITNSDRWNSVPFDTQSLFIRLMTIVDDFGRCDGRSAVISAHAFAVWNEANPSDKRNLQQVDRMLQQLEKSQLIERYEADGKRVLQITQWQERIRQGVKERWPCRNLQQNNGELLPSSTRTIDQKPEPSVHQTNGQHDFKFPSWSSSRFKERFTQWQSVRRAMGKKPKDWDVMFQEQLNWLASFGESGALEILSASIRNNWQGLFPLKLNPKDLIRGREKEPAPKGQAYRRLGSDEKPPEDWK